VSDSAALTLLVADRGRTAAATVGALAAFLAAR
jgi:hypothetical protein